MIASAEIPHASPVVVPPVKFILSIPTEAVGLVIGKQGRTLIALSEATKCKVHLQSHYDLAAGARERAVVFEGETSCVKNAALQVIKLVADRKTTTALLSDPFRAAAVVGTEKQVLAKWIIPKDRCGILIGKGGAGIKHINQASGAWVKIAHVEESSPGATDRSSCCTWHNICTFIYKTTVYYCI
jgi:transcription antitermination factor NusA-like protein